MSNQLLDTAAQAAFVAYNETVQPGQTPWKTFDGRDVPKWEGLNDSVRAKWRAAVKAALLEDPNGFIAKTALHGELSGG